MISEEPGDVLLSTGLSQDKRLHKIPVPNFVAIFGADGQAVEEWRRQGLLRQISSSLLWHEC